MRAEFKVGKVTESDIKVFAEAGVDLVLSAAYDHKIPVSSTSGLKFINVHGSLLPEGRGPWPQPWILLKHPEASGVTFHTMSQRWDWGEIVLQRPIPLSDCETLGSLVARTTLVARELADQLFNQFEDAWANRRPMEGAGSYWKKPSAADRCVIPESHVTEIQRMYRAFGDFTLMCPEAGGPRYQVIKLDSWVEEHGYPVGEMVAESPPLKVFAVRGGYVGVVLGTIID
jgi:methionyl-tRNA formyltransferase